MDFDSEHYCIHVKATPYKDVRRSLCSVALTFVFLFCRFLGDDLSFSTALQEVKYKK